LQGKSAIDAMLDLCLDGCATNLWVGIDRCFFWAYYLNGLLAFRE
jgi:hypothetical protein